MDKKIANTFGAFGYISIFCQWLWMIITLFGPLLSYELIQKLLFPRQSSSGGSLFETTVLPEPVAAVFIILAVVFSIGITIYAFVAVPRGIARTGKKVTAKTAAVTLPRVTHHKPVSKKQEKVLLERITWSVKLGFAGVPLLALLMPVSSRLGLEQEVVVGVGLFCGAATLGWFLLQFSAAKIGKIAAKDLW